MVAETRKTTVSRILLLSKLWVNSPHAIEVEFMSVRRSKLTFRTEIVKTNVRRQRLLGTEFSKFSLRTSFELAAGCASTDN